jgi:protein-L-isoaspartate(D-aspartate) O-methyltransferase
MDLALRRRFFAEEIEAVARLRSPTLVDALAAVPRERFLPPGPWTVLADVDITGMGPAKTRQTADADPARVYHNIGVAIDPERQLFNGQPATLAPWIDAVELAPGGRVLHIGAGLGY